MPGRKEDAVRAAAIERLRLEIAEQETNTALRLQLGDLLLEAGRKGEAVPVFLDLADRFASRGLLARAAAALRRIEVIEPGREDVAARRKALEERTTAALFTDVVPGRRRGVAEADTRPKMLLPGEANAEAPKQRKLRAPKDDEQFLSMPEEAVQERLEDLIEDLYLPPEAPTAAQPPTPGESGLSGLLFSELPPEERRVVLQGLKLRAYEPGDILVTEGEPPMGLALVTAGSLLLHVRDPEGRNRAVGTVEEGDFFGEVASVPGLPRDVTVVATAPGEMLELDQDSVDRIALDHPRVWARMHAVARERAAERASGPPAEEAAGPGPAEPRMRLGMVKAFLRAGQEEEARRMLLDLADDLVRRGLSERAMALLKRAEGIGKAAKPLRRDPDPASPGGRKKPVTDDRLSSWASTLARKPLSPPPGGRLWSESLADPETLHAQAGLRACRLFEGMRDEELLGFVQKLPLESRGPGEILLTEGEPSDSVLVLTRGRVKVFVGHLSGCSDLRRELQEGAFLGEIGALSGMPRTATVTTATRCVLLRVDRPSLARLCRAHPKARAVLEETLADRTAGHGEDALAGDDPDSD